MLTTQLQHKKYLPSITIAMSSESEEQEELEEKKKEDETNNTLTNLPVFLSELVTLTPLCKLKENVPCVVLMYGQDVEFFYKALRIKFFGTAREICTFSSSTSALLDRFLDAAEKLQRSSNDHAGCPCVVCLHGTTLLDSLSTHDVQRILQVRAIVICIVQPEQHLLDHSDEKQTGQGDPMMRCVFDDFADLIVICTGPPFYHALLLNRNRQPVGVWRGVLTRQQLDADMPNYSIPPAMMDVESIRQMVCSQIESCVPKY